MVTVLVVAGARLVAVDSILAGLTRRVAVGAVKARVTQTLSRDHVTDAIKTVAAVVLTVLSVGAVGTAHLTPVPDPAGVTVGALSMDGVTVVALLTRGTHLLAVFPKEALGAKLIASSPIPASVTGDAAALGHLAGLLALTVATPVPAVLSIEASRTGFPAELPAVPRSAHARAIYRVALAVDTLAVVFAARAPQPLPALAPACELLARRVVTVALDAAVSPGPARVAQAASRGCVAHGVEAAVTGASTCGAPGAWVARALARLLVTLALLAVAPVLTVGPPAVVVAGTFPGHVVTLAVGEAGALALAVWAPVLDRALSVTTGSKISMTTAAFVWTDTHLVVLAGEIAGAERC